MNEHSKNLWHLAGSFANDHHLSSLEGDNTADIVVVGGGFTGLSCAIHLADKGVKVCLLEAFDIGYGASGRNVGLSNAGLWIMPSETIKILGEVKGQKLNQFLMDAPQYVAEMINNNAMDCDFKQNGTLHLAHHKNSMDYLAQRCEQMSEYGADVSLLEQDETYALTKAEGYFGALRDARAGVLQPLKYCHALAKLALEKGVTIHTNSAVVDIDKTQNSIKVKTKNGNIDTQKIILATNAYEININENAGYFTPLYYCQLASKPLNADDKANFLPSNMGCWDSGAVMRSFRTDEAGRLIIGTVGNILTKDAKYFKRWAKHVVQKTFPDLDDVDYEFEWTGRIAKSQTNVPQIMAIDKNVYQIMGYSGRGIAPATVTGKAMAEFLCGDISQQELPLPINEAKKISFNKLRSVVYEVGCQLSHLSDHLIR